MMKRDIITILGLQRHNKENEVEAYLLKETKEKHIAISVNIQYDSPQKI